MAASPLSLGAVHEAGHAVAHLAINDRRIAAGLEPETRLRSLTIDAFDGTGWTRCAVRRRHDPHDQAVRCLAGPAAEALHRYGPASRPPPGAFDPDAPEVAEDVRMAARELRDLADPAREMRRAWREAWAIVREERAVLLRIAEALQAQLSL